MPNTQDLGLRYSLDPLDGTEEEALLVTNVYSAEAGAYGFMHLDFDLLHFVREHPEAAFQMLTEVALLLRWPDNRQ